MGAMPPDTASGTVGSGQLAGGRWRITLTLGATGECFAGSSFGAGSYTSGTACQPIGLPPVTAVLRPLTFAGQPRLAGYGGVVSSRAVTVTAALSNGTTERIARSLWRPELPGPGPRARHHADPAGPARPLRARVRHRDVHPAGRLIRPAADPARPDQPAAPRIRCPQRGLRGLSSVVWTVQSPLPGGPGLAQVRRLVTEIPGPASRELLARREASVARGVSHVLPVFISGRGRRRADRRRRQLPSSTSARGSR